MAARRENWIAETVRKNGSNSSGVPVTTIIASLGFAGSVVYGAWTLGQSQFTAMEQRIKAEHDVAYLNYTNNREERIRGDNQISTRLDELEKEQSRRTDLFLQQNEFRQFSARILSDIHGLREQLRVLETTRPTTGELQAASRNSAEIAIKLEERVRALEQYLLGQSKGFQQGGK